MRKGGEKVVIHVSQVIYDTFSYTDQQFKDSGPCSLSGQPHPRLAMQHWLVVYPGI